MERSRTAVVIGAGIMGCSIAFDLAKRGWAVTVVDAGSGAGHGSTSASSAIIRFHYSTLDTVKLAWESMFLWQKWSEYLGVPDESGHASYRPMPQLVIEPPVPTATRVLPLYDEIGIPYRELTAEDLAREFPTMDHGRYWPPKRIDDDAFWGEADGHIAGYLTPDGGFMDDPTLAAHNLMVAAQAHGAVFKFRSKVVSVETTVDDDGTRRSAGITLATGETIPSSVVVNAAGPHSRQINDLAHVMIGLAIDTRPLRNEVHLVPAPPGWDLEDGTPGVADLDLGTYFRAQPGHTMIIGGTEAECDELQWLDDPDDADENPTIDFWQANTYRAARRFPDLGVPPQPLGVGAVYDVTPDWVPVYDRTELDGFYVAIGTSGNQFKNAPMVGPIMGELIELCESGYDHDRNPLVVTGPVTGLTINVGHFSRLRTPAETAGNVMG